MAWEKLGSTKLAEPESPTETTTTVGYSGSSQGHSNSIHYKQFTVTGGHKVKKAGVRIYSCSDTSFKIGVWSDNGVADGTGHSGTARPDTLLAQGEVTGVTTSGADLWVEVTFDTPAQLDSTGKFWVGAISDDNSTNWYRDSGNTLASGGVYGSDCSPSGRWSNYANMMYSTANYGNGSGNQISGNNMNYRAVTIPSGISDTITVDSLTAKKNLMVQVKTFTTGGNTKPAMRFNNDSGSNYATRDSQDGGTDATETSVAEIRLSQDGHGGTVGVFALNINVINDASNEKIVTADTIRSNATGAGTAPARYEIASKWANTSNAITRVDIINEGTGDFAEGSEVTVYGTD